MTALAFMLVPHLRRGTLLAFDAHELGARRTHRARSHLARCPACRARLTRLRELRTTAAAVTSPNAPEVLDRIEARVRAGEIVLLAVPEERHPGAPPTARAPGAGRTRTSVAAAAVALVVLAGSVAAAMTVAPIRAWVRAHVPAIGGAPPAGSLEPVAGVAVPVGPSGMVIELRDPSPDLTIRITRGASDLLDVIGSGAAAAAEYRSAEDRVTVAGLSGGELRVVIPRHTGPVRLVSGPDTLVLASPAGLRMADGSVVEEVEVRLGDLLREQPSGEDEP